MIRKGNGERTVECLRKDQSQWNVMIWLEADQQPDDWTRGEHRRYYTLANFEPSRRNGAGGIERDCSLFVEHYYDKASGINRSLLHLPEGWFNLPLDRSLLNTINSNARRHLLSFRVTISGGGVALVPSASALKGLQLISGARSVNQAQLWVNMTPHLLTFHRDNSRLDGGESIRHQMPRHSPPTDNVKVRRVRRSIQFPPQDNDDDSIENEQTPNSLDDQSQSSSVSPLTSNNLTDIPPRRPRKRLRRHLRQSSTASANSAWSHSYQHQPRRRAYHYQKSSSGGGVGSLSNAPFTSPANRRRPLLRPITHQSYLDTSCQRRPLVVKFASIGWAKMVMAPESVDIGHCFGRCPFPLSAHYNATNYAVLLQLAHLYGATPFDGPCCVPYKFTSQSLLLHDKYENVAIQMLNNSIVESCACQ